MAKNSKRYCIGFGECSGEKRGPYFIMRDVHDLIVSRGYEIKSVKEGDDVCVNRVRVSKPLDDETIEAIIAVDGVNSVM